MLNSQNLISTWRSIWYFRSAYRTFEYCTYYRTLWCLAFEKPLNTKPFANHTCFNHSNTSHFRYLDPGCSDIILSSNNLINLMQTRDEKYVQWGSEYLKFELQKHLNCRILLVRYLNGMLFWWWSELGTFGPVFRSLMLMMTLR